MFLLLLRMTHLRQNICMKGMSVVSSNCVVWQHLIRLFLCFGSLMDDSVRLDECFLVINLVLFCVNSQLAVVHAIIYVLENILMIIIENWNSQIFFDKLNQELVCFHYLLFVGSVDEIINTGHQMPVNIISGSSNIGQVLFVYVTIITCPYTN